MYAINFYSENLSPVYSHLQNSTTEVTIRPKRTFTRKAVFMRNLLNLAKIQS